jgi:hypothetical protein
MPVFQYLLQRWGFVKLDRYGLVRTPDGRILTTHPKILDDGKGGRIVGWQDSDPAPVQLPAWQPTHGENVGGTAENPVIPATSEAIGGRLAAASAAVMADAVAGEAMVDEDDWEWITKLARARVAAPTAVAPPAAPIDRSGARPAAPVTVIPVPPLPTVDIALHASSLAPVVRPSAAQVAPRSPGRFPKGTSRLTPAPSGFPRAARVVELPGTNRRHLDRR